MCKDVPDYCKAKDPKDYLAAPATARFSVLRTGTGPGPAAGRRRPAHAFAVRRLYRRRLVGRHPGRRPVQPAAPEGLAGTVTNDPSQGFEPYVNGGAQSVYRAWYPDGGGT